MACVCAFPRNVPANGGTKGDTDPRVHDSAVHLLALRSTDALVRSAPAAFVHERPQESRRATGEAKERPRALAAIPFARVKGFLLAKEAGRASHMT